MAKLEKPIYIKLSAKRLKNIFQFLWEMWKSSFLTLRKLKFLFMEIKETILPYSASDKYMWFKMKIFCQRNKKKKPTQIQLLTNREQGQIYKSLVISASRITILRKLSSLGFTFNIHFKITRKSFMDEKNTTHQLLNSSS